tara:strand:- start:85 stop:405 length:321 start_codon:yes stop_codon:yes gene_type:complete
MNTQENNKLIAEFMGMIRHDQDEGCMIQMTHQGNKVVLVSSMKYHSSWDWLMPVVDKYYAVLEGMIGESEWDWRVKLHEQLLDINLDELYKVVVEFINEYNKNKNT